MKKIFLSLMFCTFSTFIYAKSYIYCELVGTGIFMSSKINVIVDFGQKSTLRKGVDYLKDENGKNKEFNSMVDAMNFFGKQGWEFVQVYLVTNSNRNAYHWLLKKEVTEEELNKVVNAKE